MSQVQQISKDKTDPSTAPLPEEVIPFMTRWVTALADQVKNPVAGISAAVGIFEKEIQALEQTGTCDSELVNKTISMIRGRLTSLDHYISELKKFGEPPNLTLAEIRLNPLISRVIQELEVEQKYQGTIAFDFSCEPCLICDESALSQMLRALLLNALEAVPHSREPRITISVHADSSGAQAITTIIISDNGEGLPEGSYEHLFKPFYSTKEAGNGLGLAVVKKYADAQNMELSFEPALPIGTRVCMRIKTDSTPPTKST